VLGAVDELGNPLAVKWKAKGFGASVISKSRSVPFSRLLTARERRQRNW
jgi:hypothetical protein